MSHLEVSHNIGKSCTFVDKSDNNLTYVNKQNVVAFLQPVVSFTVLHLSSKICPIRFSHKAMYGTPWQPSMHFMPSFLPTASIF